MGYAHFDETMKIGVKPKKNDNFKSGKCVQTIDFTRFAKNIKKN